MSDVAGPRSRPRKPVKPITARRLNNVAAAYVEKFAGTTARLREVLRRRVRKARHAGVEVVDDVETIIETIVAGFVRAEVLDDARYANQKAGSLHRRGTSARRIRDKLSVAGVAREDIDRALAGVRAETGASADASDLEAAIAFARRRRLGPFGDPATRVERRQKQLAAFGRGGFALSIARRILDSPDIDTLDELER